MFGKTSEDQGWNSQSESEHDFLIEKATEESVDICIEGRRVVQFDYFFKQLQLISHHNSPLNCNLSHLRITSENRKGLNSTFNLKCVLCGKILKLKTSESQQGVISINESFVSGIMSIGSGYSGMEELCATLEVPSLSIAGYGKCHKKVCEWWEKTKFTCMAAAADEEKKLAIESGDIDENGTPMITVVADACWSKRSYKTNYSALSGAATIIGYRTKKIIYMAVKNKYCTTCARATNLKIPVPEHTCFKNYEGSSSGMEAEAILDGFQQSLSMYGLIYSTLIADGDSSTYARIVNSHPYPNITVQKIECSNHLIRNYCNHIEKITKDTGFPLEFRKIISSNKLRLRKAVVGAANYRMQSTSALDQKIINLRKDLLNGPKHVFGEHKDCLPYFCKFKIDPSKTLDYNHVPQLQNNIIFSKIMEANSRLVSNARSLVFCLDSNIVESFNGVIAKFIGGKRINYSLKQSYMGRCAAAVVSFNSKRPYSSLHKEIFNRSPSNFIKRLELNREKRRMASKKNDKRSLRKKQGRHLTPGSGAPDIHYGELCEKTDMERDAFEYAKTEFLKILEISQSEKKAVERRTVLQSDSGEWLERRRNMLTASLFGNICKRSQSISCANLVKTILYGRSLDNIKSIKYGRDHEQLAKRQLCIQQKIVIDDCGLFIDDLFPFLGATPDGLVNEDTILEIKCPISASGMLFDEAIAKKKITFWKKDLKNNTLFTNTNHNWYYQVQGQLHISNKSLCIFAVWLGEAIPLKIEIIKRDDNFWEEKMEKRLKSFFMDCLLPEIIDPRFKRSMPIRDPQYIKTALEKKRKAATLIRTEKLKKCKKNLLRDIETS